VGTEWSTAAFKLAASIVGLGKSMTWKTMIRDQQGFLRVVGHRFWQGRGYMLQFRAATCLEGAASKMILLLLDLVVLAKTEDACSAGWDLLLQV